MIDQEILDNVPEGECDYFVDITGEYFDEYGNHLNSKGLWSDSDASPVGPRSLADIKRIAELERYFNRVCVDVLNNRGKVVTEATLIHIRGAIDKFNLPLDIKTLKEQGK